MISGSEDKTVRIWNISGRKDDTPTAETTEDRRGTAVHICVDRKYVVTGHSDGGISVWGMEAETMKGTELPGYHSQLNSVATSSDKQYIISGSSDSTNCIWNATTGMQEPYVLYGHEGWIYTVATSYNCRWFVSASEDGAPRLWKLPGGKVTEQPFVGHKDNATCALISSDDRFVVSG